LALLSSRLRLEVENDLTCPFRSHQPSPAGMLYSQFSLLDLTVSGGSVRLRTGVLPHGAVMSCLIGYCDPCEPDLSNRTQLSYPPNMTAGGSGSHVPYRTLLRTGLGTHRLLGEPRYVEHFSLPFLLETISHAFGCTSVVALHTMRAPSCVIDPLHDGFTQALFQRPRMVLRHPLWVSNSLPCLPLERRLKVPGLGFFSAASTRASDRSLLRK
jgi:hypothetical protein